MTELCLWLENVSNDDTARVGGKNASLGEMIRTLAAAGVRVPEGFATTADAYREFIEANDLEGPIRKQLARLDEGAAVDDVGPEIRQLFLEAELPDTLRQAVVDHYRELGRRLQRTDVDVAVRSSATAEDLPEASFAGQQETFLNVVGEEQLLDACRRCFASLFTDRAIEYRAEHGFAHLDVALSVGVQRMIRSDEASAGVMFSMDPETGFPDVVVIDAAWGLGESVVAGEVDPDEYVVFKPLLDPATQREQGTEGAVPIVSKRRGSKEQRIVYTTDGGDDSSPTTTVETTTEEQRAVVLDDEEIVQLARHAVSIEDHYGRPMDIEWAKDGRTGELFIVQARPETVQSRIEAGQMSTYTLLTTDHEPLLTGQAIGQAIAAGPAYPLGSAAEGSDFPDGGVLVAEKTDPDWVPIMRRAAAIVTDHGGRTSHAAIVSRELGVPAVIGTGDATATIEAGTEVTVSCAEGDEGHVYRDVLEWERQDLDVDDIPDTRTKVMLNLADPAAALRWWRLPADGVGLARMEFIIGNHVQVHPMALLEPDRVDDDEERRRIDELVAGWDDPTDFFVEELASGMARIAASMYPKPVIVRMSDFKTNEYADLLGGSAFEPDEENPMLGWRGASRYYHDDYRRGFELECRAVSMVRNRMGLRNVVVMIPFCRTLDEADRVLGVLADAGLVRGRDGLSVYVMAEIPSNVFLAREFARRFDGFSIGSNDLTQLVLGVDRDSTTLQSLFSERDPAVQQAIALLIERAHGEDTPVGLCGQAPSDDPTFAEFLVHSGIDSVSVTPDSFLAVKQTIAATES